MIQSIIKYYPTVSILVVDDIIFNETDRVYEEEDVFPDLKPLFDLKLPSESANKLNLTPNKGSGCSACKSEVYQIARQS